MYAIELLRGQQIKRIHAVSNLDFLIFFITLPSYYCKALKKYEISIFKVNFLDQKT